MQAPNDKKNSHKEQNKTWSAKKILLFGILLIVAITSYAIYRKVSRFISFLTNEIDAFVSPIKYNSFNQSPVYSLPSEDEAEDTALNTEEDIGEIIGEEAIKTEIPAAPKQAEEVNIYSKNMQKPAAFVRKLNNLELSELSANSKAVQAGFFQGLQYKAIKDNLALTEIVFKDNEVFHFAYRPSYDIYENQTDSELKEGVISETIDMLAQKVQGQKYIYANKNFDEFKQKFTKACLGLTDSNMHYALLDDYAYGCSIKGFEAASKEIIHHNNQAANSLLF